jgi:hypothetical protein
MAVHICTVQIWFTRSRVGAHCREKYDTRRRHFWHIHVHRHWNTLLKVNKTACWLRGLYMKRLIIYKCFCQHVQTMNFGADGDGEAVQLHHNFDQVNPDRLSDADLCHDDIGNIVSE